MNPFAVAAILVLVAATVFVSCVKIYKEKDVPVSPDRVKEIIGKADRKNRKLFKDMDMRMPFDISVKTVRTTNGHATVVTDEEDRRQLREQFGKRNDLKLIETHPVSKAYSIVSRDDAGKPVRREYWKKQEHVFGEITWQCSRCKAVFSHREAFCPSAIRRIRRRAMIPYGWMRCP